MLTIYNENSELERLIIYKENLESEREYLVLKDIGNEFIEILPNSFNLYIYPSAKDTMCFHFEAKTDSFVYTFFSEWKRFTIWNYKQYNIIFNTLMDLAIDYEVWKSCSTTK